MPREFPGRFFKSLLTILYFITVSSCATFHPVSSDYAKSKNTYILKVPFIEQEREGCCGLHCLAMVLSYWRDNITAVDSIYQLNCPKNGFSGAELRDMAYMNGFHAYIFKGDLSNLYHHLNATRPLIIMLGEKGILELAGSFLDFGNHDKLHYTIVTGYAKARKRIILMDPSRGLISISENDFSAAWERAHRFAMLIVPK